MQFKRFKAKDVVPAGGASQFKWPVAPCQRVPPADGADKARQFKAPRTPSFDMQHADKVEQAERYALPGAGGPTASSIQFKVPLTPRTQPVDIEPHIRQQVARYADWLAKQAKYDVLHDNTH